MVGSVRTPFLVVVFWLRIDPEPFGVSHSRFVQTGFLRHTRGMEKNLIKTSKFLAKHLRHAPQEIGLTLEPGGWVPVSDLLAACRRARFFLDRELLEQVVLENDKRRFAFDETGDRIRANQGHSTEVDLMLEPVEPPLTLFHGTAGKNIASILETGIDRGSRHHVHLSQDAETARKVGARHGKPVILVVQAQAMFAAGFVFFKSENNVWLTDHVPPEFLMLEP
jgi:putative RNA 2'-phosphotransferase